MREKLQNLNQLVQQYSQYAISGLREFSEHPIKYSSKALTELVKDYWDVGASIATGLAWTDYGDDLYGRWQGLIGFNGPAISIISGALSNIRNPEMSSHRGARNLLAFFTTFALGNGYLRTNDFNLLTIANDLSGIGAGGLAFYFDNMRRKSKNSSIVAMQNHLEDKIESQSL